MHWYLRRVYLFPKDINAELQNCKNLLFLEDLVSGLGLLALEDLRGGGLDDTDSDGLPHVTDSEPTQGWELREGLNTHGLAGGEDDDGSVTGLDELGVVFGGFTSTTINLLLDLSELKKIHE